MFFSQKKIKKKPPKPGCSLIPKFWEKKRKRKRKRKKRNRTGGY
jgi:hypothetical protein